MQIEVDPKQSEGLFETPLLHQTSFWSTVKTSQGIATKAFDLKIRARDIGSKVTAPYLLDDLLILFQHISDDQTVGYIPYGPSVSPQEDRIGSFLEELSESLRPLLPDSCMLLRYDLPWQSPWSKDADGFDIAGQWLGPPEPDLQELRLNWGTQERNLRKSPTDLLPADTMLLDLTGNDDMLLSRMKPKTRYNIRLAERHQVRIRSGSFADMDIFYELYRQTCQRNHIHLHHRAYFDAMFAPHATRESGVDFDLLIAEHNQVPLAAVFIVYASIRATYLFGASASENRNLMGTYLLQWEAIQRAKARGCIEYDLFGTAPNGDPSHPMHGLYRFKAGFGGTELHRMGCWDYPLENSAYQQFSHQELVTQGYHIR